MKRIYPILALILLASRLYAVDQACIDASPDCPQGVDKIELAGSPVISSMSINPGPLDVYNVARTSSPQFPGNIAWGIRGYVTGSPDGPNAPVVTGVFGYGQSTSGVANAGAQIGGVHGVAGDGEAGKIQAVGVHGITFGQGSAPQYVGVLGEANWKSDGVLGTTSQIVSFQTYSGISNLNQTVGRATGTFIDFLINGPIFGRGATGRTWAVISVSSYPSSWSGDHYFGGTALSFSAPTSRVDVHNGSVTVRGTNAGLRINGNAGVENTDMIVVSTGSTNFFRVSSSGTASVYSRNGFNAAGADLAEMYESLDALEAGDLVIAAGNGKVGRSDGTSNALLGVVSANPGFIAGGGIDGDREGEYPIALAGRVKVKVTGQVYTGDYLTTSDVPGRAKRQTESGRVVGMALESFFGDEGEVLVFINPHWVGR